MKEQEEEEEEGKVPLTHLCRLGLALLFLYLPLLLLLVYLPVTYGHLLFSLPNYLLSLPPPTPLLFSFHPPLQDPDGGGGGGGGVGGGGGGEGGGGGGGGDANSLEIQLPFELILLHIALPLLLERFQPRDVVR